MEKLLLVEDDPTLIRMLTSFLTTENFQITSVTGQKAAAEAMEADRPDLALVDISLAEGNGFAVCANAKELGVPVIFLTASSDEFSVVTGLDMGADDTSPSRSVPGNWFPGSAVCFAGSARDRVSSRSEICQWIPTRALLPATAKRSICLPWSTSCCLCS